MIGRGCTLCTGVGTGKAFAATMAGGTDEVEGVAGVGILLLRVSDLLNGPAVARGKGAPRPRPRPRMLYPVCPLYALYPL